MTDIREITCSPEVMSDIPDYDLLLAYEAAVIGNSYVFINQKDPSGQWLTIERRLLIAEMERRTTPND